MTNEFFLLLAVCTAFFLVLGIAAGGFTAGRSSIGQGHSPLGAVFRSGVWVATFALGALISVILIWLAVSLTARVWTETQVPSSASTPKRQAGSETSGTPLLLERDNKTAAPMQDNSKDAVANAMTAIGITVALVTLILTAGTGWIGVQQKALDERLRAVDASLERLKIREQLDTQALDIEARGAAAKKAALRWIQRQGTDPRMLAIYSLEIFMDLEQLALDDRAARMGAFFHLAKFFDPWDDTLDPVREYAEECHLRARNFAWYSGKVRNHAEEAALERAGLACRIFDSQEFGRVFGPNKGVSGR